MYYGFIRSFFRTTKCPFQMSLHLTFTTSTMILNVSSENQVHPSICGCRNTIQMSAGSVNIALYLTSHFVLSQRKDAYLLNTYQVQALWSLLWGIQKDSLCSCLFAILSAFAWGMLQSSRLPLGMWTWSFNRIKIPLQEPDLGRAVPLNLTFI